MAEKTIQLDIPLVAPEVGVGDADCLQRLEATLQHHRAIHRVHLRRAENGEGAKPQLCIHYDPELISLSGVRRLAQEMGSDFSARYRHEQIPFAGMDVADAAETLAGVLDALPGMLHARVNYAAGLVFVAYDSQALTRERIEAAIKAEGYRVLRQAPPRRAAVDAVAVPRDVPAEAADEEPGSAPGFLPHWMQARWELLLVGLAGLFFLLGLLGDLALGLPEGLVLTFFILAYIAGGWDIAFHAVPGLLRGRFDTDVLMIAAAVGAAVLGEWSEGAFLLFLFSLAHAGEHYALDRTRNAINALGELMPSVAYLRQGEEIVEAPVEMLELGDVVVVRPGDRVPVDGTVARGSSTLDQSAITGESRPVAKAPGDSVFAGTINQDAALDVEVTRLVQDSTLSRVMQMVAEAQSQQSPTQRFTSRFTRRFVPAVLVGAVLVSVVPPIFGWLSLEESFYRAMLLLVAASPCALALGTPAAVLAGIAQAARNGVLIKGGVYLESLGDLDVMAFDKTGTLTRGQFAVTALAPLNGHDEAELLRVAAAVEQQSSHPLAEAVVRAARERQLALPAAGELENVAGRGVRSSVDGDRVLLGNLKLFREEATPVNGELPEEVVQTVANFETRGQTTMTVSRGGEFLGIIALADRPRPDIPATLDRLRALGIDRLVMLTGDNDDVARQIAAEIGIDDVRAELLPEEKLDAIRALQAEYGEVGMAGDGVNDAPALATAHVGIAMGGAGTAVALETADVALMADDLSRLPFAVGLSRFSRRIIQQNLAISLGVILLLVATSVVGLVELSGAVVLHEGSTIVVVVNALRLLGYKEQRAEGN
ncbi:MAG: heavy metal translocating P-type ATPase [Candidatus Promineifilaceae bacterium]|nr:heavy metal translocating P-type ATPase [Candidatus Promineifilaceae bacterium]